MNSWHVSSRELWNLSLGWLLCSVRAATPKSLGSAGLREDPEGASRKGAVLESGDAFSCWPSKESEDRACRDGGDWVVAAWKKV